MNTYGLEDPEFTPADHIKAAREVLEEYPIKSAGSLQVIESANVLAGRHLALARLKQAEADLDPPIERWQLHTGTGHVMAWVDERNQEHWAVAKAEVPETWRPLYVGKREAEG